MNWESTGLLRGLKKEEVVLLTEILEKIEPKASEAYARVHSEGTHSIKDELLSNLPPIVRICWERSGIQDSEWIASDFEKWIDEENEAIEYRFKNAYMRMDVVVEIQIWYADIHGNRYLKEHSDKFIQKKIDRIENLAETISGWSEEDKDGPTVQERYLAKEILRIIEEESK